MTLPVLSGLGQIAERYDGFILDLWGVIHDGRTPYPGVIDALTRLGAAGKPTVMLSNAPRPASSLVHQMEAIGIPRRLYGGVMSSGEAVHRELARRSDPWFAALGRRCYHLGAASDLTLFEGLDLDLVGAVAQADFIVNSGPDHLDATVEEYRPVLDAAAARHVPMICANPDIIVIHQGRVQICAGALAQYYQTTLGGEVRARGKPDPAIYADCLDLLGIADRRRVLAVGDGLATDVTGASRAGIDCLFCTGGIHAAEIGTAYGERPEAARVEAVIARHQAPMPVAAIGGFVW